MGRAEKPGAFSVSGMSDAQRTEFWASLALRHTARLGPRTWKRLLEAYPTPYTAIQDVANWGPRAGISPRIAAEFRSERWRVSAKQEWDAAGAGGWRILLWSDARYPQLLKEIADPPIFLYYIGDASLLSNPGVGVVGSRLCSRDGIATTRELCRRLSASGVTTVSGLARGIDSEAHRAALESWGSTIAVLGTGPDCVYPQENASLHERICQQGLVLSEFAPGTEPESRNFPMRNRIISGLSLGVLVVEAAKRSGSLITAKHALDQGREVFAVPGRVQARTSTGCHDLIRQGAKAVFCCDDVLVEIAPLIGIHAHEWKTPEDVDMVPRSVVRRVPPVLAVPTETVISSVHSEATSARQGKPSAAKETSQSGKKAVLPAEKAQKGGHAVTLTADEKELCALLADRESVHIDELCRALAWEAGKASGVLLMLEVQGVVRQLPGMHYSAIF